MPIGRHLEFRDGAVGGHERVTHKGTRTDISSLVSAEAVMALESRR